MAGMDLPVRAIREQIASAIDLIVHQARLKRRHPPDHPHHRGGRHGGRGRSRLQDLFVFDHRAGSDEHGRYLGTLRWTGLRPRLLDMLADAGITVPPGVFSGAQW